VEIFLSTIHVSLKGQRSGTCLFPAPVLDRGGGKPLIPGGNNKKGGTDQPVPPSRSESIFDQGCITKRMVFDRSPLLMFTMYMPAVRSVPSWIVARPFPAPIDRDNTRLP